MKKKIRKMRRKKLKNIKENEKLLRYDKFNKI